jgi:hypothetical protein
VRSATLILAGLLCLPLGAAARGIPLLDRAGAPHGAVSLSLPRGLVRLKVVDLAALPADVDTGAGVFQAFVYKAYLSSSADPAAEIFLADVYPNAKLRAARRVALGGDVSRLGFDRVTVTAFSKDGQQAFDVLTASLAP